jgi:hypothetical protein
MPKSNNRVGTQLTITIIMKKIINKLLGVNIYATSKNVQGSKSVGVEDANRNYKLHMKKDSSTGGRPVIN